MSEENVEIYVHVVYMNRQILGKQTRLYLRKFGNFFYYKGTRTSLKQQQKVYSLLKKYMKILNFKKLEEYTSQKSFKYVSNINNS